MYLQLLSMYSTHPRDQVRPCHPKGIDRIEGTTTILSNSSSFGSFEPSNSKFIVGERESIEQPGVLRVIAEYRSEKVIIGPLIQRPLL